MVRVVAGVSRVRAVDRVEDDVGGGAGQRLPLAHRLLEDAVVHGDHDDARHPEGHRRRDDGVVPVHLEDAQVRVVRDPLEVVVGRVPAGEDGHEADEGGQDPDVGQHEADGAVRHDDGVLQGPHDGVVPVHRDAAQVQDGRGREVHVQRVPQVAHVLAEQPHPRQLHAGVERHGAQGDEQVRHGQRHDVVVGDDAQLAVPHHRDDDQGVAEDGAHDDGAHDEGLEHEREHVDGLARLHAGGGVVVHVAVRRPQRGLQQQQRRQERRRQRRRRGGVRRAVAAIEVEEGRRRGPGQARRQAVRQQRRDGRRGEARRDTGRANAHIQHGESHLATCNTTSSGFQRGSHTFPRKTTVPLL
ncbi:hypothetical protein ONE63_001998 [Megalurothrips usitatus]|uniref:Uncharacterized protein n=1 Tax=Megalurothrips usitatus TaxID=439358 RepID=A0AAV7XDU6_9NEOP|nr:hypothetical protein ONE63_001998 [Megalurothrips usitatus]